MVVGQFEMVVGQFSVSPSTGRQSQSLLASRLLDTDPHVPNLDYFRIAD